MNFKQKYLSQQAIIGGIRFIFMAIPAYFIANILTRKSKYRHIWLIGERYNEARDNGYHLFKYIRKNHPNIKIYYLIDKNSRDIKNIEESGNIIYFGTYKHYIYYFLANKHINSHGSGYGCMPDIWACRLLECFFSRKAKNIFIQHGITKDFMPSLTKNKSKIDLFVCGAKPEYDYVKETFGYKDSEVKYLGLARFDNLYKFEVKNQIMYMPTWRTWLANISIEEFKSTNYYKSIQSLINNDKLIKMLKQNNLKLIVCLHPITQKYSHLLNSSCENIIIASTKEYDIQNLLKESILCITDYSSVAFDFAYMEKPVIYYQFDYDEYRKMHFKEGYFSYLKDGFGNIVIQEDELINEIEKNIQSNFILTDQIRRRINKFFELRDNQNCKRIYEEIYKL